MNKRESEALDRYITGNYGEDQFKNECNHETTQVIIIKSSIAIEGDTIRFRIKERCENCGKAINQRIKVIEVI